MTKFAFGSISTKQSDGIRRCVICVYTQLICANINLTELTYSSLYWLIHYISFCPCHGVIYIRFGNSRLYLFPLRKLFVIMIVRFSLIKLFINWCAFSQSYLSLRTSANTEDFSPSECIRNYSAISHSFELRARRKISRRPKKRRKSH